jgi:hypothetical protein
MYTRERVEGVMRQKGYVYFTSDTDYDLNIIGIRNSTVGTVVTNLFDDVLSVSYKLKGTWVYREWAITTDPGKRGVTNFQNRMGSARLVPGQYRRAYSIGLHKGEYEALRQISEVKVYRDANRDMVFNENKIQEGLFGINIHKAGKDTKFVENYSEGCQVFKRTQDFNEFMRICRGASKIHGNAFTYTLLESKDFENPPII